MDKSNFNPTAPFCVEVYETAANGKPRTFGIQDLTYEQAIEYFRRMEEDSKFRFFRMYADGTRRAVNMNEYQMEFGIWKRGFINTDGEYQPSALMEICDSEAEANDHLKKYEPTKHFIEPY